MRDVGFSFPRPFSLFRTKADLFFVILELTRELHNVYNIKLHYLQIVKILEKIINENSEGLLAR